MEEKLSYAEKLEIMTEFVEDNISSVEDLCALLELSIEEIVALFPDKLVAYYGRVFEDEDEEDPIDEEIE